MSLPRTTQVVSNQETTATERDRRLENTVGMSKLRIPEIPVRYCNKAEGRHQEGPRTETAIECPVYLITTI